MTAPRKPPSERSVARHEAAHAVVAVRLDLPLVYTSIRPGGAGDEGISEDARRTTPTGKLAAAGHTKLEQRVLKEWTDALPDAVAFGNLQKVSVETAAGPVAETNMGAALGGEGSHNDLVQLMQQASTLLNVKFDPLDPPDVVTQWLTARLNDADGILKRDGGAAWDRVTASLLRKKVLSGRDVRALVTESESQGSR